MDYRKLNKVTISASLIDDQIEQLKEKKYFTILDLKNKFHHIKMNKESIPFTFFVILLSKFEYLRIPIGFIGEVALYLNYIIIASETISQQLEIVKKVFSLGS